METARREHREADDICALHKGRPRFFTPPPRSIDRFMSSVDRGVTSFLRFQESADDFAEAVAAVAHRQKFQFIAGAGFAPSRGDCARSFIRTQGALEFIWNDQNSHGSSKPQESRSRRDGMNTKLVSEKVCCQTGAIQGANAKR